MLTKEFIGGKFPKPVKVALKERADAAGLSMQEYIERVFVGHLDEDGDQMISREELNKIIQQEIAVLHPEKLLPDSDIPEVEPDTDDIEVDEEDHEEPSVVVGAISNERSIEEIGGLKIILPKLLGEELNCTILRAWESVKNESEKLKVVILLEVLADKLRERSVLPTKYVCETPYETVLPADVVQVLDPVIIDAVNEVGERPEKIRFFILMSELLHDLADQLYIDAQAIEFTFDRAEYDVLDKLLAKVNKYREANEQLADIASLIRYQLGQAMDEASSGGLFTSRDLKLSKMGEKFKEIALNRVKE